VPVHALPIAAATVQGQGPFVPRGPGAGLRSAPASYPMSPFATREGLPDRFWARVDSSQPDGCWIWKGRRTTRGYGTVNAGLGKNLAAHRASWQIHNGPIPDGLWVLHHCDNPSCVRPDHLFLGTHDDNMRDMALKGRNARFQATKTHCPAGHPYSEENTYHPPKRPSERTCKECARERVRARRARGIR
jgi:hypothetical protein